MSSCYAEMDAQATLEVTLAHCRHAAQSAGWTVNQEPTDMASKAILIGKEPWTWSWHNPATLYLEIEDFGTGYCAVRINTSNFGIGPFASSYVKRRSAEFISAMVLEQTDASSPPPNAPTSGWDSLTPAQKAASQHYAWQQQQARYRK